MRSPAPQCLAEPQDGYDILREDIRDEHILQACLVLTFSRIHPKVEFEKPGTVLGLDLQSP
jgi:hypothetical protein